MATATPTAVASPAEHARPPWTLARQVIAAALVLPTLAALIAIGPGMFLFPPVAIFCTAQLVCAALFVWRGWRWVALVGGILLFAFAAMNIPFLGAELLRPDHGLVYFAANVIVLSGVVGLVAGIRAFVEAGRGAYASPRWGAPGAVVALLVAGVMLGVGAAGYAGSTTPVASAGTVSMTPDATQEIAFTKFEFVPAVVTIPANQIVKLSITNNDGELHTFTVDELGLDAEVPAGKTVDVWIKTDKAGTFELYCMPHAEAKDDGTHEGMVAQIVVA